MVGITRNKIIYFYFFLSFSSIIIILYYHIPLLFSSLIILILYHPYPLLSLIFTQSLSGSSFVTFIIVVLSSLSFLIRCHPYPECRIRNDSRKYSMPFPVCKVMPPSLFLAPFDSIRAAIQAYVKHPSGPNGSYMACGWKLSDISTISLQNLETNEATSKFSKRYLNRSFWVLNDSNVKCLERCLTECCKDLTDAQVFLKDAAPWKETKH